MSTKNETLTAQVARWMDRLVDPETGYLKSFWFGPDDETLLRERAASREEWAEVKFGANTYAVANGLLVLLDAGRMDRIEPVVRAWSDGKIGELELRAYWGGELDSGHPYVYGEACVPGVTCGKKIDHYIFHSTRADGKYLFASHHGPTLPKFWVDWYPMSRENAWVALACLHIYGRCAGTRVAARALEIADRAAKGALLLQADTGGIRMSTMGTWSHPDKRRWFDMICTEDNISWWVVFRSLLEETGNKQYAAGIKRLEAFFVERAFDSRAGVFHDKLQFKDGKWVPLATFSSQCQLWAILGLGPDILKEWFRDAEIAASLWQRTRERAGILHGAVLAGFDFTQWKDNPDLKGRGPLVSYDRSAAASLAAQAVGAKADAKALKDACLAAARHPAQGESAWPYAEGSGESVARATGLGWNAISCEAMSLASSAWVTYALNEKHPVNPFTIPLKS